MTRLAFAAKAPFVFVIFLMAAITGGRCIVKLRREMALFTFDLRMATGQRKPRFVVIEGHPGPFFFIVTAFARTP